MDAERASAPGMARNRESQIESEVALKRIACASFLVRQDAER